MLHIIAGVLVLPVAWWLYAHCARPLLASEGARPVAFAVAAVAGVMLVVLEVLGGIFAALVLLSDRALTFRSLAPFIDYGAVAAAVLLGVVIFAPAFAARLSGGPDSEIRLRFVVDAFGSRWRKVAGDATAERTEAEWLARSVSGLGQSAWLVDGGPAVEDYLEADTPSEVSGARTRIADMLASNRPFDPISWVRRRRWASRAASGT